MAFKPYDRLPADLSGVARGRRLIVPMDADLPIMPKSIEILNAGPAAAVVAIVDSFGDASVVTVFPGVKELLPCLVSRVSATGTTISASLSVHGYFDAK